jgi:hypothetical protein
LTILLALAGCASNSSSPPSGFAYPCANDVAVDGGTFTLCGSEFRGYIYDVLFVVDSAPRMREASGAASAAAHGLAAVIDALLRDGERADFRVGVITGDLGTDGARLLPLGHGAGASCRAPLGDRYLRIRYGDDPDASNLPPGQDLETTLDCMLSVGTEGREAQQPLEAAYRALHDNLPGNEGFLRDEAQSRIVLLTNGDDSSVVPGPGSPQLRDVSWYQGFFQRPRVQGGLKDSPLDVEVGLIAGPPSGASACASPAPRLAELVDASELSASASVCAADDRELFTGLVGRVLTDVGGPICVPIRVPRDAAGQPRLDCDVRDTTVYEDGVWGISLVPRCAGDGELPCWRLLEFDQCALFPGYDALSLSIDRGERGGFPILAPPHTWTSFECAIPD